MKIQDQVVLGLLFAAADIVLCLLAATTGGDIRLYSLMATSFFMSIQFPTIFTMSLRGLGNYTKSGSSFLVMAIVGGALIPLVMGGVSDASTINDRVRKLEKLCAEFGVPLRAAALQFPLGHPCVASVVAGCASGGEAHNCAAMFSHPIPPAFWLALRERGLVDTRAPLPA